MMIELLGLIFTVIFAENIVFTKLLGVSPLFKICEKPKIAVITSCTVASLMTLSGVLCWLVDNYILKRFHIENIKTIIFVLITVSIVQFARILLTRISSDVFSDYGTELTVMLVNTAVLGTALLIVENNFSLLNAVVYGFASGIGFMLAVWIFYGVRKRIVFANPPKSFHGIPIELIAVSLIVIALSGFGSVNF